MPDYGRPQSRNEAILQNMLGASNQLTEPQSRVEYLLQQILLQEGHEEKTIEDILNMVATVEDSTTASKSYAIGDFLILDNVLYIVTKAIDSGETIIVDTTGGNNNVETRQLVDNDIDLKESIEDFKSNGKLPNPYSLKLNGQDAYDGSGNVQWTVQGNDYIDVDDYESEQNGEKTLAISARVRNNTNTDVPGYMLDARQGKALGDAICEIRKLITLNGAKNMLEITAETTTISGVTITVHKDDNGSVDFVRANGTATAYISLHLGTINFEGGVKLSGCPSGSGNFGLIINNGEESYVDTGNGVVCDSYGEADVYLNISNGCTVDNIIFRPMVRYHEDSDDTFAVFARTNESLTRQTEMLENALNGLSFSVTSGGILRVSYDDGN